MEELTSLTYHGIYLIFWLSIIHVTSQATQRYLCENYKIKWFILHTLANFITILYALPDTLYFFNNPVSLDIPSAESTQPIYIIMALHIHHMTGNYKLNVIDWVHHLVMSTLLCLPYLDISGIKFANALLFFTSGLPGGIDYILMTLVSMGYLNSFTEKRLNTYLNVYIRSPGILYLTFCMYANYTIGSYTNFPFIICTLIIMFWNAQYFMQIVVYAYGWRSSLGLKSDTDKYVCTGSIYITNHTYSTFRFSEFTDITPDSIWTIKDKCILPGEETVIEYQVPLNHTLHSLTLFTDNSGNTVDFTVLNWNQKHYGSCIFTLGKNSKKYKSDITHCIPFEVNPELVRFREVWIDFLNSETEVHDTKRRSSLPITSQKQD